LLAPAAVSIFAVGPARADCPTSTFLCGAPNPLTPIVEVAAAVDTVFSIQPCDRVHGRYDVLAGLLIASIDFACPTGQLPSGLETAIEDEFQVTGLAPGTPVGFNVVLHLRGEGQNNSGPGGGGGAQLTATLLEGLGNTTQLVRSTNSFDSTPITVDEPLTLAVTAVAGAPIRLVTAVRALALDGRGNLEGVLEFTGLPPGAHVISCRGYSSGAPVASRRTSWGRLKAAYR
jgi:hypothetical protein